MSIERVNVRGIIFKDGKLFVQRLKNGEDYWCTPGGGLDADESLLSGLHREMIEETGVAPRIGRLLLTQQFRDGDREMLEFFFHIENADDYEQVDLSSTTHGEIEVEEFGFMEPKQTYILPQILQRIDLHEYTENVKPVLVINELDSK